MSSPASLSEVLLNDLRVDSARALLLEFGARGAVAIGTRRSPLVHVVLDGAIEVYCGDAPAIHLASGDTLLVFYGDAHRIGTGSAGPDPFGTAEDAPAEAVPGVQCGDGTRRALLFSSLISLVYISPTAFAFRAAPDFWVLRAEGSDEDAHERSIRVDADQVVRSCGGQGGSAFATAFASLHFVHMLRLMSLRSLRGRPLDVRAPNTRRMTQVVREIRAHPERKWSVAQLASQVGLSRSAFAEAFVAHERVAPLAFVTRVRMERAARLLASEVLSLHEVARRVGYENEGSFARAFKRFWGVPPGEFARR